MDIIQCREVSKRLDAREEEVGAASHGDGRKMGFCKLIIDRATCRILGCHVVGEQAVEITQVAGIAMAARMRVDDLAGVPLSFPTYAGILAHVAASATRELNLNVSWCSSLYLT